MPHSPARSATLLLLIVSLPSLVLATDWTSAEAQLARKIANYSGPGTLALEVVNKSSLTPPQVEEISRGLSSQLGDLGVRANPHRGDTSARVTLSESLTSYVWVAEMDRGVAGHVGNGDKTFAMVSVRKAEATTPATATTTLTIRKSFLWAQTQPVLDVALLEENGAWSHAIVLDAGSVTWFKVQGGVWQLEQALPITPARTWPRDLRGRLVLGKDHLFDAFLPGVMCTSSASAPLSMSCRESDDPWPVGTAAAPQGAFFSATRNFFSGVLSPGIGQLANVTRFYTAASLPRSRYTLWLLTGTDDQVHLLDGAREQVIAQPGWGSDIAAVQSNCGSGWQVLAAAPGDGRGGNTVRAFEVPDREPAPASAAVDFAGPITALWTQGDGRAALAVVRNDETGKYEAYRLAITCVQ